MKVRSFVFVALLAVVLIAAAGCSDATNPELDTKPDVVLTLKTEVVDIDGEPYVQATAKVENIGKSAVQYQPGCGFYVGVTVEDAEGIRLKLQDPALVPACPPVFISLEAGAAVQGVEGLKWAWDENSVRYRIPGGIYTIRTAFDYYFDGVDEPHHLEDVLSVEID